MKLSVAKLTVAEGKKRKLERRRKLDCVFVFRCFSPCCCFFFLNRVSSLNTLKKKKKKTYPFQDQRALLCCCYFLFLTTSSTWHVSVRKLVLHFLLLSILGFYHCYIHTHTFIYIYIYMKRVCVLGSPFYLARTCFGKRREKRKKS